MSIRLICRRRALHSCTRARNCARAPVVLETRAEQRRVRPLCLIARGVDRQGHLHRSVAWHSPLAHKIPTRAAYQLHTSLGPWYIPGLHCDCVALSVETIRLPPSRSAAPTNTWKAHDHFHLVPLHRRRTTALADQTHRLICLAHPLRILPPTTLASRQTSPTTSEHVQAPPVPNLPTLTLLIFHLWSSCGY